MELHKHSLHYIMLKNLIIYLKKMDANISIDEVVI